MFILRYYIILCINCLKNGKNIKKNIASRIEDYEEFGYYDNYEYKKYNKIFCCKKKSKKYKELISKEIKIVFKAKKSDNKIKNENLSKVIEENTSDLINNISVNESIITNYIYNYKFTYDGINHNRTENIKTNLTTKYNYDTETYNNSNTTEIIVEDNYIENTTNINSSNIQEANNFSNAAQNPFTLGIHKQLYNNTIYK